MSNTTSWSDKNLNEVLTYIASIKDTPEVSFKKLLGDDPKQWKIKELVGAIGNLNFIYVVEGPKGSVLVKWAPPYVKVVPDWKLETKRANFEVETLLVHGKITPSLVPKVYHFNKDNAMMIMEYLHDCINLRVGLIQGIKYPLFAEHAAEYMAETLFRTSDLYLKVIEKMQKVGFYSDNGELCDLTQKVIFMNPFIKSCTSNKKLHPSLDDIISDIQEDDALKLEIIALRESFRNNTQALVHGDLHTSSVMVNQKRTVFIDPEFSFYGPIGFDPGLLIGNLFISYYAQDGFETEKDPRKDFKEYLLNTITTIWNRFSERFLKLWNTEHKGDLYPDEFFENNPKLLQQVQKQFMQKLFSDTLGFAGLAMMRRVIGIASCPDVLAIKDPLKKASAERKILVMGRKLVMNRNKFKDISEVCEIASRI